MSVPLATNPLLLLDYDGTLAEIVARPEEAYPHPAVPELLGRLRARFPLYLVTGRSVRDLEALLPVPGLQVVGVHGMEAGTLGGEVTQLVDKTALGALEVVRTRLPDLAEAQCDGLRVEDKGAAIALHYRGVGDGGVEALQRWADAVPNSLDQLWGKMVLELRPAGYSKGLAAARLARTHAPATPVFIGDDTTDEEAFAALQDGLTIKVGEGKTRARERLADVAAVVAYLERYLALDTP